VDHAVLATYSAELSVTVAALLALSGCDLDNRRTGSRIELVRAIEMLGSRVRVLIHPNRIALPRVPRAILALLDRIVRDVQLKKEDVSWHPKIALVRLISATQADAAAAQWRLWIGSRNLTKAMNWEAGIALTSSLAKGGQRVEGIAELGAELARRAEIPGFESERVFAELRDCLWDAPSGTKVNSIRLSGDGIATPLVPEFKDAERVVLVSPFLDATTVQRIGAWGGASARRALVSITPELQKLHRHRDEPLLGFGQRLWCGIPDLPAQGAEPWMEDAPGEAAEPLADEEIPPAGLHAKLLYAAKGSKRRLWIGSANATERAWAGRNVEVVAELEISREAADALEAFVAGSQEFTPTADAPDEDPDDEILDDARNLLAFAWHPHQTGSTEAPQINGAPPLQLHKLAVKLEVAGLGQSWQMWEHGAETVLLPAMKAWQQTDLIQVRLTRGARVCGWVQFARWEPRLDRAKRDRALIAEYLDARSLLLWLRSMLNDVPPNADEFDWDGDPSRRKKATPGVSGIQSIDGAMPTVEEILRAWARSPEAFEAADRKMAEYCTELEQRARRNGSESDAKLLADFAVTWEMIGKGLR
jgi:hypothetical protein